VFRQLIQGRAIVLGPKKIPSEYCSGHHFKVEDRGNDFLSEAKTTPQNGHVVVYGCWCRTLVGLVCPIDSDILACNVARSALTTEILAKVPLRILDPAQAAESFDRVGVLDQLE
jgi:hypothetical protein